MKYISSVNNAIIKEATSLKKKKYRDQLNLFLIEGYHLVEEALKAKVVETLFITREEDFNDSVNSILVSEDVMNKLSDTKNSQNIMAVCKKIQYELDMESNYLLLDGLQDPGNIGTLLRSALAFGFQNIIFGDGSVDLYNEKLIRSTQGMLFHVNIMQTPIDRIIPTLSSNGYQIIGTSVTTSIDQPKHSNHKIALILGNEGNGMSQEIKSLCDRLVTIDIKKEVESLNVSVAGSILMYLAYKGDL